MWPCDEKRGRRPALLRMPPVCFSVHSVLLETEITDAIPGPVYLPAYRLITPH
jgi:hypothetical protein